MEFITYKLKDQKYKDAVLSIIKSENPYYKGYELDSYNSKYSIKLLQEAGVLDLWFTKSEIYQYEQGDYIIFDKGKCPSSFNIECKPNTVYKVLKSNDNGMILIGFNRNNGVNTPIKHYPNLRKATNEEIKTYMPFKEGDLIYVKYDGSRYSTHTEIPMYCNNKNDYYDISMPKHNVLKFVKQVSFSNCSNVLMMECYGKYYFFDFNASHKHNYFNLATPEQISEYNKSKPKTIKLQIPNNTETIDIIQGKTIKYNNTEIPYEELKTLSRINDTMLPLRNWNVKIQSVNIGCKTNVPLGFITKIIRVYECGENNILD